MGCDIHIYAERKTESGYQSIDGVKFIEGCNSPFDWRAYGMFAFLAGVRNYSGIDPISEPRGLPENVSESVKDCFLSWDMDAHSASWLSVKELSEFDYDAYMEDRRVTRQISQNFFSGAETANEGCGEITTYRDFLGSYFFEDLKKLQEIGAYRVVFWFDN